MAGREAAPDVATTDDNGQFDAELSSLCNLRGYFLDDFRADAVAATWLAENFSAEFEHDPFVADMGLLRHG